MALKIEIPTHLERQIQALTRAIRAPGREVSVLEVSLMAIREGLPMLEEHVARTSPATEPRHQSTSPA